MSIYSEILSKNRKAKGGIVKVLIEIYLLSYKQLEFMQDKMK